jgi:hypothetical protein
MNKTYKFRSLPVTVADETQRYDLFDILLPYEYDEESILLVTRLLGQLRSECNNDRNQISRMVSQFLDSLPFFNFNYLFFATPREKNQFSETGITYLYIGDKQFTLSTIDHDECMICITLMKVYLEK